MAFSIEALQCKSRLNNERLRRAARVLHPELMRIDEHVDDEGAAGHEQHTIGHIVSALMCKLRQALGPHHSQEHRDEGDLSQVIVSDRINPEGFVEISVIRAH